MPKVTVIPSGISFEIDSETSLLEGLRRNGYYVKSTCGGKASCSDCIVKIKMGEDNLSSQEFPELRLMGNVFHITKERLSCQTKISGDVVVDISDHNQQLARPYELSNLPKVSEVKTVVRTPEEQKKVLDEREDRRKEKQEKFQQKKESYGGMSRPKTFNENIPKGNSRGQNQSQSDRKTEQKSDNKNFSKNKQHDGFKNKNFNRPKGRGGQR